MAEVKLELTCGRCGTSGAFEAGEIVAALELAEVEGWRYLTFSPIGKTTRTKLADLCPKCFSEIQYSLQPSTLSLFGGAYDAIRAGS